MAVKSYKEGINLFQHGGLDDAFTELLKFRHSFDQQNVQEFVLLGLVLLNNLRLHRKCNRQRVCWNDSVETAN